MTFVSHLVPVVVLATHLPYATTNKHTTCLFVSLLTFVLGFVRACLGLTNLNYFYYYPCCYCLLVHRFEMTAAGIK